MQALILWKRRGRDRVPADCKGLLRVLSTDCAAVTVIRTSGPSSEQGRQFLKE
jgi:hypothetical protein